MLTMKCAFCGREFRVRPSAAKTRRYCSRECWRKSLYVPVEKRLAKYIIKDPETGCWNWISATVSKGYGVLSVNGKMQYVHRLVWEREHGPIPNGMQVCHSCDNPRCCNPEHLFLGTRSDNMLDMVNKGRDRNFRTMPLRRKGEDHPQAKLTWAIVREIRDKHASGNYTYRKLAEEYRLGTGYISDILRRRRWVEEQTHSLVKRRDAPN